MKSLMNYLSGLILSAFLMAPSFAGMMPAIDVSRDGGSAVGNGGGVVLCKNADQSIKSVELLDYFEARVLRKIAIDTQVIPGPWKQKVQTLIERLGKKSELRLRLYGQWLKDFEEETLFLTGVTFNPISDTASIGIPTGCQFAQAAVQIMPRFPDDYRYFIDQVLWNAMDDTQKAGLVLHELVYREALSYGHTDSFATRYMVARFSSPTIDQLSLDGFLELLILSRFEQSDVPYAGLQFKFSIEHLWRGLSKRESISSIPEYQFKDRMVVNLGACLNEGCHDWRILYDVSVLANHKSICTGAKEIQIGSNPAIIINENGEKARALSEKCKMLVSIYTDRDYYKKTHVVMKGAENFESMQMKTKNASDPLHEDTFSSVKEVSYVPWKEEEFKIDSIFSKWVVIDRSAIQISDRETDCFIETHFSETGLPVRIQLVPFPYSGANCVLKGELRVQSKQGGSGFDLRLYISPEARQMPEFVSTVYVKSSSKISDYDAPVHAMTGFAQDGVGRMAVYWFCYEGYSESLKGCLQLNPDPRELPDDILSVSKGMGFLKLDYVALGRDGDLPEDIGDCSIMDGRYPIYPNGVPHEVKIATDCKFIDINDKRRQYRKGAKVRFNAQGRAI